MDRLILPEKIETDRLLLARLRYEEAEEIFYAYASKPEVTNFLAFPTHQSIQDARSFLNYAVPSWDTGNEYVFGIRLKEDNRFIGTFGVVNDEGKVHVGYSISPSQWGQGFTAEAGRAVITELKKQKWIYRVWAFADAENTASHKVLLKCGFVEEARLEKWFRFINQDNQPKDCVIFILKG